MNRFIKIEIKPLIALTFASSFGALTACQSLPASDQPPAPEPESYTLGAPQTLTILPNRLPCQSVLPMQCLQIQIADQPDLQLLPYNAIVDFTPNVNTQYQITARPQLAENTKAPNGRWNLVEILQQTPVRSHTISKATN